MMTGLRAAGLALAVAIGGGAAEDRWALARANGAVVDDIFVRTRKMVHAWLKHADPKTLLLPDRLPGVVFGKYDGVPQYTPHNSGADNYPFLTITAWLTDRGLYEGRMVEMLRNEVRYTDVGGGRIPGNLRLDTHELGPPSFFGAGEYCKDGMIPVTELLGRGPWYFRMVDMTREFARRAPVKTRWGNLPDTGAELNGDVLQVLARLIPMTGDRELLAWAEQIGDAYIHEILPANHYLPGYRYDFEKKADTGHTHLGDHGNELMVGLILLQAIEAELGLPRAATYAPVIRRMLDRVLESANADGMIYRTIQVKDLKPVNERLTDCWGYVYASMYAFYQATGDEKYRDATRRVLKNLVNYRDYGWEKHTVDDLADSVEGAIYLVNREPVPEAMAWIDEQMKKVIAVQKPDGFLERWYGDGNWNRTLLLYALMKTQGARLEGWAPGVELGAVRQDDTLYLTVHSRRPWAGRVAFDFARHRRVLNYRVNYVRLNEWPEWWTVDENRLYTVGGLNAGGTEVRLGSELKNGVFLKLGAGETARLTVAPAR
jgi:hypothetical protein